MPDFKNAFVEKDIHCPICNNLFKQKITNDRNYIVTERDSDQNIVAYKWKYPEFNIINPSYYVIWQCPICNYADMNDFFETAQQQTKFPYIRRAFTEEMDEKQSNILLAISKNIDRETEIIDFKSALFLHLAAVFCQTLPKDDNDWIYSNLARIYLRLAWLFRAQQDEAKGKNEQNKALEPISNELNSFLNKVEELDSLFQSLELNINNYLNSL